MALAAGGIVLAAFSLRAARLDYQSLWYDEGSSLALSHKSVAGITYGAAADIHPPLYYYLLHFWMLAAGQSEYAVRSLSVAAGALIVALLFVLGRHGWGQSAGLIAGLAGAVSPLLVYYSQETRMYAQVTLFGLLSTYLLMRATATARKPSRWFWLAYGVAAVLCLYSQYIGALALAFQGLYVLLFRRKALPPFILSAGAAALLFAPWAWLARGSLLGWPSTDAFHAGPQLFGDAAFRYVEGLSANPAGLPLALTVILVGVALLAFRAGRAIWLPVLYVAVPLFAMFLLGYRKPIYNPKFALLALPGFLVILAAGVDALGRLRAAGIALLLVSAGYALNNYYTNPDFQRDNYRGVAQFIATSQRPGDAIILNAPGQEQIFPYYYHGSLPEIGLPSDRPLNPDRTAQQLAQLNGQYRRLWLVLYGTNGSDPNNFVENWLAGKDFEIQNQWFGNVRLAAFAAPSTAPAASQPADATLGRFAHLSAYSLTPDPVASGDVLQLGLTWHAEGTTSANEKVFTHVIDAGGNIWAQRDSDPQGGARPTSTWKPGQTIADNYGLLILPGTPPGQYQAEIGMYDPADPSKRVPVSAGGQGDRLLLTGVHVAPAPQAPSLAELRIPHGLSPSFGAIRLLGYGLTLVGQDAERDRFRAGDEMHLTLFWQADAKPAGDEKYSLALRNGAVLAAGMLVPQHPTSSWRPGDRFRDQYKLRLPSGITGDHDLVLRLDSGQPVTLTRLHVGA